MTSPRPEERVARLVEWIAAIAGPLTAVTAVLYFFGWTRTNAVFGYFGVDPAILDFDVADYLARAAGPAFGPAVGVTMGAIVLVAADRAALALELACRRRPVTVAGRTYVLRFPSTALVYAGLVATWCGARVALGLPDFLGVGAAAGLTEPIPAALALAAGPPVLAAGLRLLLLRSTPLGHDLPAVPVAGRILVGVLVLVSLFWATSVYSGLLGERLAAAIDADPRSQPEVVVHSEESLGLWSATPALPVSPPDAVDPPRYRFSYTGLRLLIYANDRWLLLTGERSANGRSRVAVLQDDDTLRVELAR